MLRAIIVLIILASYQISEAQFLSLGPKAGINYSNVLVDETFTSEGIDFTYATSEAEIGLAYGAYGRIKIGPVFFQPELMFTQDRTEIEVSSLNIDEIQTLTINKMDIPLLAGLRFGKTIKIMGGPVKSYVRSSKVKSPGNLWDSYRSNMEDATWGYQVGFGLDIGRFMLDLRYEDSVGDITTEATIGNETFVFDHRQEIFQITLAYQLLKTN